MTRSALARGSFFALLSLLVISPGVQASLPPQSGATAGRCNDQQVKDLFPEPEQPRPELRVLVTSFSGADQNAQVLGQSVGRHVRTVLETHAHKQIKSDQTGLHSDAIRIKFVPCTLDDHEHARKIGESAHADVVLWGEAFCTAANPRARQTTTINVNSGNVIQDSPGARIENKSGPMSVHVSDGSPTGRFTTSLTVVRWHGLEGSTASGTQVRRFDRVADLGLSRLVSEQPQLLLDVVLGLYASRAGRHGLAAEFFERVSKDVAASAAEAANLYRLIGISYLIAGRKEQGLATLETARQSCTEPRCEATALHCLGWAKSRLGDKKTALSYYDLALPLRQKEGDVLGEATTLNNIGAVYDDLGDKKMSLSYYQRALSLEQRVGDISLEATTLNNVGVVYSALGEKKTALSYYQRALLLEQKVGNVSGEATTLNNIGAVYNDLGDKKTALSYYQRALSLEQRVGDISLEATTLNNVGVVYSALGNKKTALSYYQRALPLQQKVGDVLGEATTLNIIGLVYDTLGEKTTALSYYQRALPLQQKVSDISGEATTLNIIGGVHFALGDKKTALSYFLRTLPLQQKVGDISGEATTLNVIGGVHFALGDKKTALSYFLRTLPLQQKVGDVSGEATTLHNIGLVYDDLGDKKTALSFYHRALPLRQKVGNVSGEASTLHNIGLVYDDLGDKKTALSFYHRALPLQQKMGDVSGEASTLNNIGIVYDDLGDKKTALSYYQRALPLRQKVGDVSGEGITYDNLAFVLRDLGRISEAIRCFRDASACYLRRSPADIDAALNSLTLALSLAMRARKTPEANEVSKQLDTLDPDELRKLLRQARIAGQSKSASATARYQHIAAKASTLPPKPQARLRAISQAGLLREQHRTTWPDCSGILITEVAPASQAESLGLRAGDIALRYQGSCLLEPNDLIAEASKTKPEQPVTIELWRDGAAQTLPAKGGKLDMTLESF